MSETTRLAIPEMPISSSITTRSPGDSMMVAISPVVIIAVTTHTAATSATWRPTDRRASVRRATIPRMAVTTTAPATQARMCTRSPGRHAGQQVSQVQRSGPGSGRPGGHARGHDGSGS